MNAKAPILTSATLRITRVRIRNAKLCVVFGHRVDIVNNRNDPSSTMVASISSDICDPRSPQIGEIWEVYGETSKVKRAIPNSSRVIQDTQIKAQHADLLRPSGSQLVQWLADNIRGIGKTIGQRLYDTLDDAVYDALDSEDHAAIEPVIRSPEIRKALFKKWLESGDAATLRFVQQRCIPLPLARKVIKYHGKNTIDKLIEDPYRLLSFTGSWPLVDGLARDKFNCPLDDTRRLSAALEEALYNGLERGHTCQSLDDLYGTVRRLLKPHVQPKHAFGQALIDGQRTGQFMLSGDDNLMLHATGTWLQEKSVAMFVARLLAEPKKQQSLFKVDIESVLDEFERDEQAALGIPDFRLNAAQRQAVEISFNNGFSIITGGAGVGKTTVLKALYRLLDHLGRPRYQMALSGRATARMIEATQEPATTIAAFLKHYKPEHHAPVVIIDEASMLDLNTIYQLSRKLPLGTHLILVGDPFQLPPIGAGLVLHLLCEMSNIPTTELTVVKRQAEHSAIPAVAKSVRDGEWPELSRNANDEVCFIPCSDNEMQQIIMNLYDQDRENSQILGAVKHNGFCGVNDINSACHSSYAGSEKQLHVRNTDTGEIESTRFSEGDLLLYTANDWQRGLQNGSLGQLLTVYDNPQEVVITVEDDEDELHKKTIQAVAVTEFDGKQQYLTEADVDYLEHAYAITVHKAQGSQFERVIVPIRKSLLLDRTFVYTAITRAKSQVILIGDEDAVRTAVEAPPKAFQRQVGLGAMLANQ